ncbi:homeobox protein cut-like [Limulus polyphemus]|uniref:Homeobox protein cut-like n=1 Tax=Limulus polyphemus TaxID=6850 RepID=A0ABM1BLY1_LIMPO|nr:homeobox protein cut-like [Limulus polyphemus]
MEVFMNGLERASQRASLAEKEATALKKHLQAAKQSLHLASTTSQESEMSERDHSPLELDLAAKDKEISQLVEDIKKLKSTINNLKETSAYQIAQLEEMLAGKTKAIQWLEKKLTKQRDYEEIKKEINILKSTELRNNTSPEDDNNAKREYKLFKSMDISLMEKDKNLSTDNSTDRSPHINSTGNLQNLGENLLPPPVQNIQIFTSQLGEKIVSSYGKILNKEEHLYTHSASKSLETSTSSAVPTPLHTVICSKSSFLNNSSSHKLSYCDNATVQKLQECLRNGVVKYAKDALNTLSISRCVRELLSIHNIGQRLFAKFILGLSQGTVSELLSKPKPWDKLTEKGKDSYRKMHAWATDDSCIYMLKTLVPKKGKDYDFPVYRAEDPSATERITQILNEAQKAMLMSSKDEKELVVYNGNQGNSPERRTSNGALQLQKEECQEDGKVGLDREGNKQWFFQNSVPYKDYPHIHSPIQPQRQDNDGISQETMAQVYQKDLAKLIRQRMEDNLSVPRDHFERTQDEIHQALSIYYQELSRLSQLVPHSITNLVKLGAPPSVLNESMHYPTFPSFLHSVHLNNPQSHCDVGINASAQPTSWSNKINVSSSTELEESNYHGSAFSYVKSKAELCSSTNKKILPCHQGSNTLSSPSAPTVTTAETSGLHNDPSSSASPLQRMQSITNSLLAQSAMQTCSNYLQRPVRAMLPSITQHQFDQYNNMNTEEIVKNVKELLSQFSISQRLFGEKVLGLSQGSVSDLLARPKPWYMLTQKGREPFIRMKIFLEDENSIHKLVASQYRIPPEKLMHPDVYLGSKTVPGSSKTLSQISDLSIPEHLPLENNYIPLSKTSVPVKLCQTSPETVEKSLSDFNPNLTHCVTTTPSISSRHYVQNSRPYVHPSVYEMAALTTDLDTQSITSKVKETLSVHNIGQKVFGEAVLGLSQGSVSELLSKPKPWHMLSIKGREPFIRMQMWLNDPHSADKLQALKNDRREANKRKRNHHDTQKLSSPHKENHIFKNKLPLLSPYSSAKKPRILFSEEQKEALRLAFSMDPYPSTATIEFLGSELNLSIRTVTNWFHNYRMRLKQQTSPAVQQNEQKLNGNSILVPALNESNTGFDPLQFRFLLNCRLAEVNKEKGKAPKISNTYRNCSPLIALNENSVILDPGVSGQQSGGSSCSSFHSGPFEAVSRSPDNHLASHLNDYSNSSHDRENSDRESLEEQQTSLSSYNHHVNQYGLKRTVATCTSSNRRKPAMPQWVNPELKYSPDSDVKSDDDENAQDDNTDKGEIINGVCVRQTGDFNLDLLKPQNTVEVELVPGYLSQLFQKRTNN